jgi:hypothetical protein
VGAKEWLARYATVALLALGGLEWLLGRTVSRLASAPMLTGRPRDIIEGVGRIGYFLVSPTIILAVLVALLAAFMAGRDALVERRPARFALACYLALFAVVVTGHTFLETQRWLNISFNILSGIAVWWLTVVFLLDGKWPRAARVGVLLAAVAYTGWFIFVLQELSVPAGAGGGQSGLALAALNVGELAAIAAPFAFFGAVAGENNEWRHARRWIVPVVVGLVFSAGNVADMVFNMGFTGVFTTWSLGLNLVWPWPLYAAALAVYIYAVITAFASRGAGYACANVGAGLLLLLFAGYNLQIPYQHLLAVISLALLTGFFQPFGEEEEVVADDGRQTTDDRSGLYRRPSSVVRRH